MQILKIKIILVILILGSLLSNRFAFAKTEKSKASIPIPAADSALVDLNTLQNNQMPNLELTRFLFTQVLQSYLEDGNEFVATSAFGSNADSYEFLITKKFFVAFLRRWEEILRQPEVKYKTSLEVFRDIFKEPGFLQSNQFYLKNILGVEGDFAKYNVNFKNSPRAVWQSMFQNIYNLITFKKDKVSIPSLTPAQDFTLVLGENRLEMLVSILSSEQSNDLNVRARKTLTDMEFFLANTQSDRKTCFWIISFFLSHPNTEVVNHAEKTLALIDKNEFADLISELRWYVLGGSAFLKSFGSRLVFASLVILNKFPKLLALAKWFLLRKDQLLQFGSHTLQKSKLTLLSIYRQLKFLQNPKFVAASTSISGHWFFYQRFLKPQKKESPPETTLSKETSEKRAINEIRSVLAELDMAEESQNYLRDNFDTLMIYNPDLKKYFSDPAYRQVLDNDPTPMNILDDPILFSVHSVAGFQKEVQNVLDNSSTTNNREVDFFSIFAEDDYHRNMSDTRVNDLRILSLAKKTFSTRNSDLIGILRENLYLTDLVEKSNRPLMDQVNNYLMKNHLYFYIRDSRSFLRQMLGEGGNCVTVAMLQTSLFSPRWDPDSNWKLGLVFEPQHMYLTAFNKWTNEFLRFDNLQEGHFYQAGPFSTDTIIYDPKLFLALILGPEAVARFLANPKNIIYGSLNEHNEKVELENIHNHMAREYPDWVKRTKEYLRYQLDKNFDFAALKEYIPEAKDHKEIPEFKVIKDNSLEVPLSERRNSEEQENPKQTTKANSVFANWEEEILRKIQAEKPNKKSESGLKELLSTGDNDAKNRSSHGEGGDGNVGFSFADSSLADKVEFFGYNLNLTEATSPQMQDYLIPVLKGKLGYFYWSEAEKSLINCEIINCKNGQRLKHRLELQRGFFLLASLSQQDMLAKLSSVEMFKIILMSFYDYGKQLAVENKKLESDIIEFFKNANSANNAGLIVKHSKLDEMQKELLKIYIFNLSLEALINTTNSLARSDGISNAEHQLVVSAIQFFEKINVPSSILKVKIDESEAMFQELWISPVDAYHQFPLEEPVTDIQILPSFLMPISNREFGAALYPNLNLHSFFLKNLGYQSLIGTQTKPYALEYMQLENGRHTGRRVLLPHLDSKLTANIFEQFFATEPSGLDGEFCLYSDKIDSKVRLKLLSSTNVPQMRAEFLLSALNLQELQCHTRYLAASFHRRLAINNEKWEFVLPSIEMKQCKYTPKPPPKNINLPALSKELCQSLPGMATEGFICLRDADLGQEQNTSGISEACLDPQSRFNFKVEYKTKMVSKKAEIQIPFENFLSLYSNPYANNNFKDLPFDLKEILDNELITLMGLEDGQPQLFAKISKNILEHLKQYTPYYNLYWSSEIKSFCKDLFNEPSLDESLRIYAKDNKICVFEN